MRYRGRTFIRERVHVCGDYADVEVFPVYQPAGKRRKKCRPTSEIQEKINQRNAERKLVRLVHNNFTEKDLAIGLSYDKEHLPESIDEAKKALRRFLRALRAEYKRHGLELKYITTTEQGKTTGRVHHHMILNGGVDRDVIEKLWGNGYANTKRLQFGKTGVAGLACYMVKGQIDYRRYNCSRNLDRPVPAEYDGRMGMAEQARLADMIENGTIYTEMERVYPDFECVETEAVRNEFNGGLYLRIFLRRRSAARHGSEPGPRDRITGASP